jgi:hypothetical protein
MTGNSALILALVCGLMAVAYGFWAAAGFFPRTRATPACRRSRRPSRPARRPTWRGSTRPSPSSAWCWRADRHLPGRQDRHRLCHRRGALGRLRLHRHERLGARQRAHRAGGHQGHWPGAGRGLPRRRHHRHAGGGPGPAGRDRLSTGSWWATATMADKTWPRCSTR